MWYAKHTPQCLEVHVHICILQDTIIYSSHFFPTMSQLVTVSITNSLSFSWGKPAETELRYPYFSVSSAGKTALGMHFYCHKFFNPWWETILLMGPLFPVPLLPKVSYFCVNEPLSKDHWPFKVIPLSNLSHHISMSTNLWPCSILF